MPKGLAVWRGQTLCPGTTLPNSFCVLILSLPGWSYTQCNKLLPSPVLPRVTAPSKEIRGGNRFVNWHTSLFVITSYVRTFSMFVHIGIKLMVFIWTLFNRWSTLGSHSSHLDQKQVSHSSSNSSLTTRVQVRTCFPATPPSPPAWMQPRQLQVCVSGIKAQKEAIKWWDRSLRANR